MNEWMSEWVSQWMRGGGVSTHSLSTMTSVHTQIYCPISLCSQSILSIQLYIKERSSSQSLNSERTSRKRVKEPGYCWASGRSRSNKHCHQSQGQGRYLRAFEPTQLVLVIQAPHKHFGSYCSCWLQPGSLLSNETRNKGRNKALKHEGAPLSKESISKICFSTWNHQSVYKQVLQRTSISTDMDDSCRLSLYLTFSTVNIYRLVCFLYVHLLVFEMGVSLCSPIWHGTH